MKEKAPASTSEQLSAWWQPPGWRRGFGWIGAFYGGVTARRMARPPENTAPIPVICIGNFVAGGAGKTPVAMAVADRLWELDLKPVFLTRGYLGRLQGPLLVDEQEHSCFDVGDEPLLLADRHFTVMSKDRPAGARLATWLGADVVVMDDGFQNPSLRKDLSLIVVDGRVGIGNGLVLPMGPLRASLKDQLPYANAIIVVNYTSAAQPVVRAASRRGLPVLHVTTTLTDPDSINGKRLLAFAGLGRPEKFFQSLTEAGGTVVEQRRFADHYAFSEADARSLMRSAQDQKLTLATTAKDHTRLRSYTDGPLADLADRSLVVDIRARFEDPTRLDALLSGLTAKRRPFSRALYKTP